MATIGTRIYTALKGRQVGQDALGNRYYEARGELTADGLKKRWVIYEGAPEPTKVPPEWFGWLHYTTNEVPTQDTARPYEWVKPRQPNLTGTSQAYVPQGHVNRGGKHAATVADYEPWKP